jgi:hypothetical protein
MSGSPSTKRYLVRHADGSMSGPVDKEGLKRLVAQGVVSPDDEICVEGDSRWVVAWKAKGLFAEERLAGYGKPLSDARAPASASPTESVSSDDRLTQELRKLASLRKEDLISEAEYVQKKALLLGLGTQATSHDPSITSSEDGNAGAYSLAADDYAGGMLPPEHSTTDVPEVKRADPRASALSVWGRVILTVVQVVAWYLLSASQPVGVAWVIGIMFGGINLWLWVDMFRSRCPKCRLFGAKQVVATEQFGTQIRTGSERRTVEHRDWATGRVTGTSTYNETVPLEEAKYLHACRCRYCGHVWTTSSTTLRRL